MTTVKRLGTFLAALLLLVGLLSAAACRDSEKNYKPVKSSDAELAEMVTLGGETVRYELLRAFMHALRYEYDGGDTSLWQGGEASALFSDLTDEALSQIADIYATFSVCEKYGIDPYGKKVNAEVERRIRADIDGGIINDAHIEGYGSKAKYLDALKKMYMNDSVNRLLHRWDVCSSLLYTKVVDNFNGGANSATREEVEEFYYSDDCAQISWLFISNDTLELYDEAGAEAFIMSAYEQLYEARADYSQMLRIIAGYTYNLSYDQIENGFCISRFGGIGGGVRELIDSAFALGNLDISDRITTADGVYYLVGLAKSAEYFSGHYEILYDLLLANRLYLELDGVASEMLADAVFSPAFGALDPASEFGGA